MTDNVKSEVDVTKLLDRRDAATTKEFWGDIVRLYQNAQYQPKPSLSTLLDNETV